MSFETPFWMTYNKESDLLYVSTPATNYFFKNSFPSQVNTYDGMVWKDVTPEGAPVDGSYWIEFMPSMPNTYLRELLQPQEERTGALAGRLYRPKEPVLDRPSIVGQSDLTTFLNERMPVGWFYVVNFELTGAPQATVSENF